MERSLRCGTIINLGKSGDDMYYSLCERSFGTFGGITRSEFIGALKHDVLSALSTYNGIVAPVVLNEKKENLIESIRQRAIYYAESKWKTEKRRAEYIDEEVRRAREIAAKEPIKFYEMSYFRLHTNKGGEMTSTTVTATDTDVMLGNIYDELVKNDVLPHISGWGIRYTGNSSMKCRFSGEIEFKYDAETTELIKKNDAELARSINRFYAGSNYWGD